MKRRLSIAAMALCAIGGLWADQSAAPARPVLPAAERLVYDRTIGDKRDQVETVSRLVSSKGETWYELTSRASEQDLVLRLDPATLLATEVEVTSRGADATLKRVTTILDDNKKAAPDEVVVSGFESLPYTLRAFPWGERQKARISFLGASTGGSFRFDLSVAGKETLQVGGMPVECWKAQLSLGGIMGGFFGKSYLWYSTAYPHYLVRSESASGGPGSPTSVLTLASYYSSAGN